MCCPAPMAMWTELIMTSGSQLSRSEAERLLLKLVNASTLSQPETLDIMKQLLGGDQKQASVDSVLDLVTARAPMDLEPALLATSPTSGSTAGPLSPSSRPGFPLSAKDVTLPLLKGGTAVLNDYLVSELYCSFPPRCRCAEEWVLLFSPARDGDSFSQFYSKIQDVTELLFVVLTTKGMQALGEWLHSARTVRSVKKESLGWGNHSVPMCHGPFCFAILSHQFAIFCRPCVHRLTTCTRLYGSKQNAAAQVVQETACTNARERAAASRKCTGYRLS